MQVFDFYGIYPILKSVMNKRRERLVNDSKQSLDNKVEYDAKIEQLVMGVVDELMRRHIGKPISIEIEVTEEMKNDLLEDLKARGFHIVTEVILSESWIIVEIG